MKWLREWIREADTSHLVEDGLSLVGIVLSCVAVLVMVAAVL